MNPVNINKYISIIYRYGQRYFSSRLRNSKIDTAHLPFLLTLYRSPGISQETLSRNIGFDKGTTARCVAQLEELGLIERTSDPADLRKNLVWPTEHAMEFKAELFSIVKDLQDIICGGLPESRREEALELLSLMTDNIKSHFIE